MARLRPLRTSLLGLAAASALLLAACGDDDDTVSGAAATTVAGGATTTAASEGGGYGAPATTAATTAPASPATTAGGPATTAAASGGDTTVALAELEGAEALVNSEGFAVYLFTNDSDGTSACNGGCAEAWPPVLSDGEATAGEGLDAAKLGIITRDDGNEQVTFNGHPLYLFAADTAAGQANGQGSGGVWFLVDAAGEAIE